MKRRYQHENFSDCRYQRRGYGPWQYDVYEGNATRAHLKGEVKLTSGLGFLPP
jgi:cyanophycinase